MYITQKVEVQSSKTWLFWKIEIKIKKEKKIPTPTLWVERGGGVEKVKCSDHIFNQNKVDFESLRRRPNILETLSPAILATPCNELRVASKSFPVFLLQKSGYLSASTLYSHIVRADTQPRFRRI